MLFKDKVSIFWFRRDLRLQDNAGLSHALQSPYPVVPVFIFDPEILDKLTDKSDKRVSFIYQILKDLDVKCRQHGSTLRVFSSPVEQAFKVLLDEFDVQAVYANHDYEPYAINRDRKVNSLLNSLSVSVHSFKDQVIFERSEILKADGSPYTMFTPYSRRWKQLFVGSDVRFPSENYLHNLHKGALRVFPELTQLGFVEVEHYLPAMNLSEETIRNYNDRRNIPSLSGTSQCSPYLRFGTVSVRHLVSLAAKWSESWLNELIWREFFMMILYHFPDVVNESFKRKYDNVQWRNNEDEFKLWCEGRTGYPIVDAGMRQLNETGLMHNRVRMIVAGFLTKHLLIDWRWGEAYFAQKLLDYELSSNNGNWQWAAGTGCDSAPYFRIFNPRSQTLKFDPQLLYIKTWIKDYHNYNLIPIVDHEFARKRALEVFKRALSENQVPK